MGHICSEQLSVRYQAQCQWLLVARSGWPDAVHLLWIKRCIQQPFPFPEVVSAQLCLRNARLQAPEKRQKTREV